MALFKTAGIATQRTQDQSSKFAVNLYRRLCTGNSNAVLSPYSVWVLLALASEGASGDTRDELLSLLGCPNDPPASKHLVPLDPGDAILNIANGVWSDLNFPIDETFRETARIYGAEVESLDFADPDAVKTINDWACANTMGKIPHIVAFLDRNAPLIMANAIYFKGMWEKPFVETSTWPQSFTLADGSVKRVETMHSTTDRSYYEDPDIQAVLLRYRGTPLTMIIVLPRRNDGLLPFNQSLDSAYLHNLLGRAKEEEVALSLPRFNITSCFNLVPALQAMGARSLFEPNLARLDTISPLSLFVGSVVQKALCEVNEEGTIAAAVTTMMYCLSSEATPRRQVSMIVDHPFHFAIFDRESFAILFMGSVFDPR